MNSDHLIRRIDAMIRARNTAHDAQQRFADAHTATELDPVSGALYEATYELVNRIDNLIDSIDWQNLILSHTGSNHD